MTALGRATNSANNSDRSLLVSCVLLYEGEEEVIAESCGEAVAWDEEQTSLSLVLVTAVQQCLYSN